MISLGLIIVLTSLHLACRDNQTDTETHLSEPDDQHLIAEQIFREDLSAVNFANFHLKSFEKTDGYSQEFMGLSYYQFEFKAVLTSEKAVDFFHRFDGSMLKIENYEVDFPRDAELVAPDRARDPWFKGRSMMFGAGSPITVLGTITLQQTEQGWREAK